ncbi:hypothetical protein FB451DRAFT_1452585 [Mycena latifolia]|nr:hypothetical protein FB451DRAFT_1452585 [Mycena latifolia]
MSSSSASSSSARRLSLHPSALSDAEHALFTASLADLADNAGDWAHASVSVREARAWLRGRYASLPAGTVDEILRLFAPAATLDGGAFFAALRLVLHAQAGRGVERSLAFVQAPVPASAAPNALPPANPFLPTPAPSPEAPARPPLPPRKPTSPGFSARARKGPPSSESSLSASTSSSSVSASPAPARRTHHAHSSSLSAVALPPTMTPPTHPLRRASTTRSASSSSSAPSSTQNQNQIKNTAPPPGPAPARAASMSMSARNPFRPAPLPPPRRASSSGTTATAASPFDSQRFSPPPPPVHPATPTDYAHAPPTSPFDAPRRAYPPSAGPRTAAFTLAPAPAPSPSSPSHLSAHPAHAPHAHDGRRAVSDSSAVSPSAPSFAARRAPDAAAALPLALPKALRRTLAGAGWVGAERGEREGLVRGQGRGVYTARNARRAEGEADDEREWEGEGEGEAWGAL